MKDESALLAEVCRVAVAVGGYRMAWAGHVQTQAPERIKPCAAAGQGFDFLATFEASWAALPEGTPGPLPEALRRGQAMLCHDLATSAELAGHAQALQGGLRSLLALPLMFGGQTLGVLALYSPEPQTPSAQELMLFQEVADNVAFALDSLRVLRARDRLRVSVIEAVSGLSGPSGQPFFEHMLGALTHALSCKTAYLVRLIPEAPGRARLLAGMAGQEPVAPLEYELAHTPCQHLLSQQAFRQSGALARLYPHGRPVIGLDDGTYMGHRLDDSEGQPLGMLFVLFEGQPKDMDLVRAALQVFASRAAAEIERMDADQEIRSLTTSLEERVAQRTAQLQLANDELESFSYSVSHDLRTPLSAVDGFATLLEQSLARSTEPLAERQRHYLSRIRAGMVQMGELIEALLQLARLARAPMTLAPVDLSALARDILGVYSEREPTRALDAVIEPDLLVKGDARLLRQLMENLLGNAWKFSSGQARTHIRVARAAVQDGAPDQPVFVVEDKGAGFNMAYAQKLFGPFQRLHSPSEFEGSGIGLATVKRIVHRHGGRVWGEAEPGRGARFYFSLGAAPEL